MCMSDTDFSETVKEGSNNIIEGLSRLKEGIHHFSRSLSIWFSSHRLLKYLILAPVSAVIGSFGIQMLTQIYAYFFSVTVPISRDIEVSVFPAPIGFTLWVLLTGFILAAILVSIRFVKLRQRIDELEEQIQR